MLITKSKRTRRTPSNFSWRDWLGMGLGVNPRRIKLKYEESPDQQTVTLKAGVVFSTGTRFHELVVSGKMFDNTYLGVFYERFLVLLREDLRTEFL